MRCSYDSRRKRKGFRGDKACAISGKRLCKNVRSPRNAHLRQEEEDSSNTDDGLSDAVSIGDNIVVNSGRDRDGHDIGSIPTTKHKRVRRRKSKATSSSNAPSSGVFTFNANPFNLRRSDEQEKAITSSKGRGSTARSEYWDSFLHMQGDVSEERAMEEMLAKSRQDHEEQQDLSPVSQRTRTRSSKIFVFTHGGEASDK